MPITSYAQNSKNVVLWRALAHVERGFYVDIGARDPVVDSVSLAFYEQGWRGVHIEPGADNADKLRAARPDEDVIQTTVAQEAGDGSEIRPASIPSQPLSAILSPHGDRDIHWMKIDMDGMEARAIKSWLPSKARPWVVVVGSTKPKSADHAAWEADLLDIGYEFVYFDGLKRYYLSVEHPELRPRFDVGPNYLDVDKQPVQDELASRGRSEKMVLEAYLAEEKGPRPALENRLAATCAPTSWRIISPVRTARRAASWLGYGIWSWATLKPGTRPWRVARRSAVQFADCLNSHPRLAAPAKWILRRFPTLTNQLHAVVQAERYFQAFEPQASSAGRRLLPDAVASPSTSRRGPAISLRSEIDKVDEPQGRLDRVFFWIESTRSFPRNSGIQRVTRMLARSLMEQGVRLVPVARGAKPGHFKPATTEDLVHMAKWNGPAPEQWSPWIDPTAAGANAWFVMPELPLDLPASAREALLDQAARFGLRTAAIFYDAIPWKMRNQFPIGLAIAHHEYMRLLSRFDLVFPISEYSRRDLLGVLADSLETQQAADQKIIAIALPGELPEIPRTKEQEQRSARDVLSIFSVCSLEPRKNIGTLLDAFTSVRQRTSESLELTIVGRFIPRISDGVRTAIMTTPGVTWIENVDDAQLQALYVDADFTVFPSIEEGFGLPILESLWKGRPCICADFGAMAEVAEGGGCLMVDVRDTRQLADAIERLARDAGLRESLAQEAAARSFKTWRDYAFEITTHLVEAIPVSDGETAIADRAPPGAGLQE